MLEDELREIEKREQRDELVFKQQISKDPWCQPIIKRPRKDLVVFPQALKDSNKLVFL